MDALTLVLMFLTGVAISGCVVTLFSPSLDLALDRILAETLAQVWSKYAKFALFVSGLGGGLGSGDMEDVVTSAQAGGINGGRCLLAVLKTAQGSLEGSSWSLLLIFGAAALIYAGRDLHASLKQSSREQSRPYRREQAPSALSEQARP